MGKTYVVELDSNSAAVFGAANGSRTVEQIAHSAGITIRQAEEVLSNLAQVGAVEKPA